jgi:prepilin-type N-terminal cleavage/methylation domain-containing protein
LSNYGFSLTEILITLILTAMVATLAMPNYSHLYTYAQNQRVRTELQRTLAYASNQANSRGAPVTLCGANSNYQQCAETWNEGMLVVSDNQILYVVRLDSNKGKLHWRSSFKLNYLQYHTSGGTSGNGTFWYCAMDRALPSWAIVVNLTGRARVVDNIASLKKLSCS